MAVHLTLLFSAEVLVRFFKLSNSSFLLLNIRRHLLNILMYLLNIVHVIHLQSPRFPYLLIKKIVIYIHMALKAVTCQSLSRAGGVSDCEKGAGAAPAPVPGVKVEGETDPRIPFLFQ